MLRQIKGHRRRHRAEAGAWVRTGQFFQYDSMSTTLRQLALRTLRFLGVKCFVSRSGLGYPFLCHLGDFAGEVPFYNRGHSRTEIEFMASWCKRHPRSLVFDVGANIGFVATQLAQAAKASECRIVAFEAVYSTFAKLTESVKRLGLQEQIVPICCAVSDRPGGICSIAFDSRESLFAQVRDDTGNRRAGSSLAWTAEVTLDSVVESMGQKPTLLKIDVEGYEAHVLRGARSLLQGPEAPAICFELNPLTLKEVESSVEAVAQELRAFRFFYLDDFENQRIERGKEVVDVTSVTWCCNLAAIPRAVADSGQIENALENTPPGSAHETN
jgi:FkbM family methyltransferase